MRHMQRFFLAFLLALLCASPAFADAILPEGLTVIEAQAFMGDVGLRGTLIIPDGVTEIGAEAFKGCTGLTSVVIPDSVTKIGAEAFAGCTNLTAVRFPTTAVMLSAYAFARTGLTGSIRFFTDSIIDPNAFYGCVNLTYEIGVTEERTSWVFSWNGHKYQVFDEYRSWSDADAYCRSVGGHLLTITSAEEQSAVAYMLDQCGRNNYFIGGTDSGSEGTWRWTTGEEFSYTNWAAESPDNFRGKEHYLTIWNIPSYGNDEHAWNDHTASGYYSDDMYDLWRSPDQVGFICEWGVDESAEKEIWASGSGLFWPILDIPYEFEIRWKLKCDEIPNGGYNVYLFSEGESTPPFKLNDTYITGTTYRGSSEVFQDVIDYYGYILNAHIMVEYVDMETGAVQYLAKTTGSDFKAIRPEDDAQIQYYAGMFELGYQAVVLLHDIIHDGEYQIGDETYTGGMDREFYTACLAYKTASGKLDELDFQPTTRGALMAIAVMEDVAARKPREPVMNAMVKNVMALAGFDMDLIDYAEDQIVDESLLQYALAYRSDVSSEEVDEARDAYHRALVASHDADKISGLFNAGQDALEAVDMVMAEYASYHAVTRSDIQPYIDAFRESGNKSLLYAADCLEVMTAGDDSLITFLLLLHGGQKVEAKVAQWGYEGITKAILGPEWKLFVSGVDLAANVAFNAAEGFSAQIMLMSLVEEIETIRQQFGDAYHNLITEPVTSYDTFMEEYYQPFVELKDSMLAMTKIELEQYSKVKSLAYDSIVGGVILSCIDFISGDSQDVRDRPAEEYLDMIEGYIEPALKDFYQIFVEPYSW